MTNIRAIDANIEALKAKYDALPTYLDLFEFIAEQEKTVPAREAVRRAVVKFNLRKGA